MIGRGGGDRTRVQIPLKLVFSITCNRIHKTQLRTIEDRRAFDVSARFLYNVIESPQRFGRFSRLRRKPPFFAGITSAHRAEELTCPVVPHL